MEESAFNNRFQIYTDEGLAKNGSQQRLPVKPEKYFKNWIKFESSKNQVGLQMADFAAFVISKTQRIMFEKNPERNFRGQINTC